MSFQIESVASDLREAAEDAKAAFGSLTVDQLNWKPAAKTWSVAQCLDHLIVTHSLYFPLFEKLANGTSTPTFWEKMSPLSVFFGRFLIKSLDPANVKPMKTTAKAQPSSSDIDAGIVDRFVAHQDELITALQKLPDDIDMSTTITSPLMRFVTYSLDDCLTFVPMHCRRHFNQAKRVTVAEGFPTY